MKGKRFVVEVEGSDLKDEAPCIANVHVRKGKP